MNFITHNKTKDILIKRKSIKTLIKTSNFQELYKYIEKFRTKEDRVLISIILPLYNEEKTIRSVLESLPKHELIEIIVIDDHSTDDSLVEINKVKPSNNIKVLHHKKNKGYGGAITTGMKYARGRVIISMDSDGQHSADDICELIKPIFEGISDLTIGSRYLGSYNYQLPWIKQLGEVIIEKLIRLLFGLKIRNNQNGFRAFNRKIIKIFNENRYSDFTFCTEQLLKTKLYGYKVKECPIKVYGREHGASKIRIVKVTLNMLTCLLIHYLEKINIIISKNKRSFFLHN